MAGNYTALEELGRNQPIGQAAGVEVLPITSIHQDTGVGLDVTYDFRNLAAASAFTEGIVAFAREHQPPWLGIGNEVNRIAEDEPEAFEAWVTSLPALRDAIRQASPETRVFVTFQYEFLLGDERVSGRVRTRDWSTVERVTPYLDAVADTTYPYFTYADPSDVPVDYYREAVERSGGLPVGFTEIGWPSASLGSFEGTAVAELGGTPAKSDVFGSIGLYAHDGTPKPALQAWLDFVATR